MVGGLVEEERMNERDIVTEIATGAENGVVMKDGGGIDHTHETEIDMADRMMRQDVNDTPYDYLLNYIMITHVSTLYINSSLIAATLFLRPR